MKPIFLKGLSFIFFFIRLIILLFLVLVTIHFATKYVDNPRQYPTLMQVNAFEEKLAQPLINEIKQVMPYRYQGVDYSEVILIVILLLLASFCNAFRGRFDREIEKEQYNEWRSKVSSKASEEQLAELDTKFEALTSKKNGKPIDRKQLLRDFVLLKSRLDGMGQQLAFLAIDVVDSTGMKKDEDKHVVSYDFDRYNEIAIECLKKNGVVKYAMTPDGIMSCFRTVDDAVTAATDLLERLKAFNQHEKKINSDFSIRAGINSGFIYLDEETPLEQISDRAIDIAGHMQKHAKPDSINIAATAIEPLKNRGGFQETVDVIDDQRVYRWTSK